LAAGELVACGIHHRFACTEKEPNCNKDQQRAAYISGNQCGERGKNAPPDHSCREYASWAKPIREFTADCLEQCVSGD
jgi:hypothetical protein